MDTDEMIKANDILNCFLHCDRSAMKETFSACRRLKYKTVPEGLDIDRLVCSIKQAVKEHFIRVYQRSSVFIL